MSGPPSAGGSDGSIRKNDVPSGSGPSDLHRNYRRNLPFFSFNFEKNGWEANEKNG